MYPRIGGDLTLHSILFFFFFFFFVSRSIRVGHASPHAFIFSTIVNPINYAPLVFQRIDCGLTVVRALRQRFHSSRVEKTREKKRRVPTKSIVAFWLVVKRITLDDRSVISLPFSAIPRYSFWIWRALFLAFRQQAQ